jgi:CPA1 family monovalent cation:H+ antiporter
VTGLDDIQSIVVLFVFFVTLAALVGIAIRRTAVPYSVALVAVGLLVGALLPDPVLVVTPELVLMVLLPGLVFEAALHVDLQALRRSLGSVVLLAGPGVIVVAAAVAVFLSIGAGLPVELGIIVGAMVAATDPAAVIATFKRMRVPGRLAAMVEGESLFNDGTGLVLFALSVSALTTAVTAADVVETLVVTVVTSMVIGLGVGFLASRVLALTDDHLLQLTISVSAAYGTYVLADLFHESGVIATVIAGIVIGNYGRRVGISRRAEQALDLVWEFVAFLLTALAFMLVGLSISIPALLDGLHWIVWGVIGVLVGRAVVVYGMLGGALWIGRRTTRADHEAHRGWLHVLYWSGLRGAVAVAMALSLPTSVPERQLLLEITFGIVLFTLVVQGTTIEPLIRRWLHLRPEPNAPSGHGPRPPSPTAEPEPNP